MPNWCSNTLWVEGNPEQLKDFKSKTTKQADHNQPNRIAFTLEGLYPTPAELMRENAFGQSENSEELTEKYGASDWYTWRVSNWGTKWDVTESDIYENSDTEFMVVFDSAWAPPTAWLEYIAPQFPELKFKLAFSEPGMGFCGQATWDVENGFDMDEAKLEWQDERGAPLEYDGDAGKWKNIETGEIIDDEDFYPIEYNPYMN
jgi:hypothetical protein